MKIATWNINGIRARQDSLRLWIEQNSPDIVVLQEVKAAEADIPPTITGIGGYRKFWNASSFRKGYSGVGILFREDVCAEPSLEIPPFDVENRTVVLHAGPISLVGTYVPRGDGQEHYAVKLQYLADLRDYLAGLLSAGREVVLAGDLNVARRDIDVHRSQNKPGATGLRDGERAAIDACLATGLHDVMRERNPERTDLFTWWPNWRFARERNLGWRIDCCYLSAGLAAGVTDAIVDVGEQSSDHAPVMVTIA